MKSWVRTSLRAGVLAAGFLLFAGSPAQAGDQVTAGNSGIGSGNNVSVPVAVAANACGNGVGVAGVGVGVSDSCMSGASNEEAGNTQVSSDNSGIATGNNAHVPIAAAGNLCGNGVGVVGAGIGVSDTCAAGAKNENGSSYERTSTEAGYGTGEGAKNGGDLQFSGDNSGILTGNNVHIPIAAALNVCGNGVGVAGVGVGVSDSCGAGAKNESVTEAQWTVGNSGILTGNNISIPISLAANVCGNGVGVAGVGVGVSDTCLAKSKNQGENAESLGAPKSSEPTARTARTGNKTADRGVENTEALPSLSTPLPLPAPVDDVAAGLLGSSPDLSAPTQGNSVNLPV